MKKTISISLFTVGVLSSPTFAKPTYENGNALYLSMLENIQSNGVLSTLYQPGNQLIEADQKSKKSGSQPVLSSAFSSSFNGALITSKSIYHQHYKTHHNFLTETFNPLTRDISGKLTGNTPFPSTERSVPLTVGSAQPTENTPSSSGERSRPLTVGSDLKSISQRIGEVPSLSTESPVQLTVDSDLEDTSGQPTENAPSSSANTSELLTVDAVDLSGQTLKEVSQSVGLIVEQEPPIAPPLPSSNVLERLNKKGAGFNFGDVLGQLKKYLGGNELRSPKTTSDPGNRAGIALSFGTFGKVSGKEAQKFAERFAALRKIADESERESVGNGGRFKATTSVLKVAALNLNSKATSLKKEVSAKILAWQKKVSQKPSDGSGNLLDQLKHAKLSKAIRSSDFKGNLLSDLKKGILLKLKPVVSASHLPQAQKAPLSTIDLEGALKNATDLFSKKKLERPLEEIKTQEKSQQIQSSAPLLGTSLSLVKEEPAPLTLPLNGSAIQEGETVELHKVVPSLTLHEFIKLKAVKAEKDDWEDEEDDDDNSVTTRTIVVEPEIREEIVKTVIPTVGRLAIDKNVKGDDFLSQIRAVRSKAKAHDSDQDKIRAVLEAERIRVHKIAEEARGRDLQEKQLAAQRKLKGRVGDEPDMSFVLASALKHRRGSVGDDEFDD